jgi:Helix-turn-helix.
MEKGTEDPIVSDNKGTSFAERLKGLIPENGIRELCRITGISYGAMQKYLSGSSSPKLDNLTLLADTLRVDIGWLATGKMPEGLNEEKKVQNTASSITTSNFLVEILSTLSLEEQNELARLFARKGVEIALYLLDEENIKLLQQPDTLKAHMLNEYVTGDHVVGKSDAPGSIDKVCAPADETQATTESLASEKKAV